MRHYPRMKRLVWLPLILAASLCADEGTDRASIGRVIALLNQSPQPSGVFADKADASALDQLWSGKRRVVEQSLTVTISHQPWGEATFGPGPSEETVNPRISGGEVRFITADVALADGTFTYTGERGVVQSTPLVFVLKKDGDSWKIASVRIAQPLGAPQPPR
jgi:hypothetical protein